MFSQSQRFEKIKALQKCPENIRNICIIAHVDHGKTTLSDCLLSYNNIISKKLAGKLRLLDTRPDEQERRITMKSSSISLVFNNNNKDYLINLVDSPGHVEFSSEVASALRLCDGALILVDAIEGVSSRTLHVLKQAFEEKVQTILVINKVDRLINELKLTPDEAYKHLNVIIDEMNAALSAYITSDIYVQRMKENEEKAENANGEKPEGSEAPQSADLVLDENVLAEIENKVYFSPEKNNVLFTSAIDNWCFDVMTFARMIAQRMGCSAKEIQKYMWGEYYLDIKNKKIYKTPFHSKAKPIFVQYILESLWQVYDSINSKDGEKMMKIAKSLKISLPDNFPDMLAKDMQNALTVFMWKWLPIDEVILKNVVRLLPNPIESQKLRLPMICKKLVNFEKESKGYSEETKEKLRKIRQAVETCDNSEDAPVVIYIAKMVNVPKGNINEHGLVPFSQMNYDSKFVGFARIFSGVLKRGSEVTVISARSKDKNEHAFDKKKDENVTVKIETIYLQYSQYLEGISEIPSGNCFAIGDLESALYKTATVSNFPVCPSFSPMTIGATSLLKVAISPKDLNEYPQLFAGLKKLNKSDPSVEIYYNENGDLILSTCGEVHLERCITDLETMYAKVAIKTSEPIISFKETIMSQNLLSVVAKEKEQAEKVTYEKPVIDKAERKERAKKEKTEKNKEKIVVEGESESSGSEVVSDTGADEEEDKRPESNMIKRELPKNLVTKNYAKIQLKSHKLNTIDLKKKVNVFECTTPNKKFSVRVRAVALKYEVAIWLENRGHKIRKLFAEDHKSTDKQSVEEFIAEFNKELKDSETEQTLIDAINNHLVCFGPRKYGPNLLLNKFVGNNKNLFSHTLGKVGKEDEYDEEDEVIEKEKEFLISDKASSSKASSNLTRLGRKTKEALKEYYKLTFEELSNAIAAGFDLATSAGPLCEEPMIGVCYIVEDFKFLDELPKLDTHLLLKQEKERERELERQRELEREKERQERKQRAEERKRLKAERERAKFLAEKEKENKLFTYNYMDQDDSEEYEDSDEEEFEDDGQILDEEEKKRREEERKQREEERRQREEERRKRREEKERERKAQEEKLLEEKKATEENQEQIKEENSPQKEEKIAEPETPQEKTSEVAESPTKKQEIEEEEKAESTAASERIRFTKSILNDPCGPISGQIMSAMKEACLESFLGGEPRLVEGVYLCYLQVPINEIGSVYDVLHRRRSTIVTEEMNEMNYLTVINAHLPVIESFGFYSEMWRKTSGVVNPQLEFDTWRILEEDPFYIPETEEEIEELGETGIVHNFAKSLIEKIRKRKGLQTEEKIVAAAEKQRTLAKKK